MRMLDEFHSHGKLVRGLNSTFIVLIPKKEEANTLNDYRSISLVRMDRIFFKIDFAKAYDSVDWEFLKNMLDFFNFDERWTDWIMEGVSSAYATVLVNGSPSGEFKLERGLGRVIPFPPFCIC